MKRATATCLPLNRFERISIHALVKRATVALVIRGVVDYISIHALVKRATIVGSAMCSMSSDFNPRPREEGDTPLGVGHGSSY